MKNPRIFMYDGRRLSDLDGSKTPDEIKAMHAADYPELTTCTVAFSKKDGKDIYTFKKAVGTKG
jgi:PRTRC genetic system protein C